MNDVNKDIYLEFRCLFDLRACACWFLDRKWLAEQLAADTWRSRTDDRFWERGASFTEEEFKRKLEGLTIDDISTTVKEGLPLFTPILGYIRRLISSINWEPHLKVHQRKLNVCLDFGGLQLSEEETTTFRRVLEGSVQPYVTVSTCSDPLWCKSLGETLSSYAVAFVYRLEPRWVTELENIEAPSRYVIVPKLVWGSGEGITGMDSFAATEFALQQRISLRFEDVENYSLGWRIAKK